MDHEIRPSLDAHAAHSGNSLPTFRDNPSVASSRVMKSNHLDPLDFLIHEDGTDRVSRNVGNELPLFAAEAWSHARHILCCLTDRILCCHVVNVTCEGEHKTYWSVCHGTHLCMSDIQTPCKYSCWCDVTGCKISPQWLVSKQLKLSIRIHLYQLYCRYLIDSAGLDVLIGVSNELPSRVRFNPFELDLLSQDSAVSTHDKCSLITQCAHRQSERS